MSYHQYRLRFRYRTSHRDLKLTAEEPLLELLMQIVQGSGIEEDLTPVRPAGRPGPRPNDMNPKGFVVGMLGATIAGKPATAQGVRDFIFDMISEDLREKWFKEFGIEKVPKTPEAQYRMVLRTEERMLEQYDTATRPRNRVLTEEESEKRARPLPEEEIRKRERALAHISAKLLLATFLFLPEKYRSKYSGHITADGTYIGSYSRQGSNGNRAGAIAYASSDPECGKWVRDASDHSHAPDSEKPAKPGTKTKKTKFRWGWEGHTVFSVYPEPVALYGETPFPNVALGFVMDEPTKAAAQHAALAIEEIVAVNPAMPRGIFVGDALFGTPYNENFALRTYRAGFGQCVDLPITQIGVQGAIDGAILVDGGLYCHAMPAMYVWASFEYRMGVLTNDEYQARLRERQKYAFVAKHATEQRYVCPAQRTDSQVACPRKEDAPGWATGTKVDIETKSSRTSWPSACRQKSVTLPVTSHENFRYMQAIPYKTPEWQDHFAMGRNTAEGKFGDLKRAVSIGLADASSRCIRGRHRNWFRCLIQIAAANLLSIKGFLDEIDNRKAKGDHDAEGRIKWPRRACTTCLGRCYCRRGLPEYLDERERILESEDQEKAFRHFKKKAPAAYVAEVMKTVEAKQQAADEPQVEATNSS